MTKLPTKLNQVVKTSNIELSKAEAIAANYAPLMMEVKEEEAKLKRLEEKYLT